MTIIDTHPDLSNHTDALLITRGVYPVGSNGLPENNTEKCPPISSPSFHVSILIPCYKEPLEVVGSTVLAALATLLPASTTRSIYLLDDGDSAEKRDLVNSMSTSSTSNVTYISGRVRPDNQINGKSENLNNALRLIFADYANPDSIPSNELVVVFDSDMRARKNFLLKAGLTCHVTPVMSRPDPWNSTDPRGDGRRLAAALPHPPVLQQHRPPL